MLFVLKCQTNSVDVHKAINAVMESVRMDYIARIPVSVDQNPPPASTMCTVRYHLKGTLLKNLLLMIHAISSMMAIVWMPLHKCRDQ